MRSSKSRSRSKSNNRQRPLGNIINRVFDSSGPEGKVRGTPQQIIDKYLMLARDAQLSNDRVAEQNFLQHAEHYTRLLSEAQREFNREQELRQNQPGGNQQTGGQQNGGQQNGGNQNGGNQNGGNQNGGNQYGGNAQTDGGQSGSGGQPNPQGGGNDRQQRGRNDDRRDREGSDRREGGERPRQSQPQDRSDDRDDGPGLVETPEARTEARAEVSAGPSALAPMMPTMPQETGDAPAPSAAERKPRGPRKPKAEGTAAKKTDGIPPADAAE